MYIIMLTAVNLQVIHYSRNINDRVKASSNCRASDGSVMIGSWKTKNKPVKMGKVPTVAASLHALLLFHLAHICPAQVLPSIFIPSTACNNTHPTRPPYNNQLRTGHLCKPSFTNSKSSIDESRRRSRWIAK